MRITLVNPQTLIQPDDPLTTGIYYFPITLASLAATLRDRGHSAQVVDAFGENPSRVQPWNQWWMQGLTMEDVVRRVAHSEPEAVFVYAGNLVSHEATLALLKIIAERCPQIPRIVIENTQAVTAYSLRNVLPSFFQAGATHLLTGECEERSAQFLEAYKNKQSLSGIDGLFWMENGSVKGRDPSGVIESLDALPFPAWDLFPLNNYWRLGYAHGPVSSKRWLPLLTSRGCPYPCKFCVVPETNKMRWRARSAANVCKEMRVLNERFGVSEFHIEDLNPTIDEARMMDLSSAILAAGLKVTWKIVAGTKLDILKDSKTLDRMAEAGCRYISMSPESGSPEVLKRMGKPFRHEEALQLVKKMNTLGIRSQACFVVGYPEETDQERAQSRRYIHQLTRAGIDEVAQFICTPVPGSAIYGQETGFKSLSELSFSPAWRLSYQQLSRYRFGNYVRFLFWKLIYHPFKFLAQPFYFLRRRFHTKMEMSPYRTLYIMWRKRIS